ncbi:LysR family transcriptional regulator [Skermania piniformis]|uniref:LysR family transcriptional regulator n=1 Tax=Skermania pinensis TaxID=39122 RepID=A0ABX8S4Q3_9ACTN|nr:LysR family transcriptional regulator [Skermania piniformis]QXQ12818.1 LysR family transcriptional regulator [Skermania piniformis]
MELHQLRYVLAVVDEGTFTSAAQAVRISQSGVSTQIRKLEHELGVHLLDRSARRVALTPEGARLLPFIRAAVAAIDDVTGAADNLRGLVTGSLRVAAVAGLVWPPLVDALAGVRAAHRGIDIQLREGASADLIAQVRDGRCDVAIAAWPAGRRPEGVQTAVVFDDQLVAVVDPAHPWSARAAIEPAELSAEDLVSLPPGTGSRDALDALLLRAGRPTQPRWEVATPAQIESLTARGLGVGVVSETTARDWSGVVALRIDDLEVRSLLGVVWRIRPSHAASALLARLPIPPGVVEPS